jgi:hypothetical protein
MKSLAVKYSSTARTSDLGSESEWKTKIERKRDFTDTKKDKKTKTKIIMDI